MSFSTPTFSVIVSVYNSGLTLERCLESLVSQTYKDIEIIVVDKESTDQSLEIEQFYQDHFPKLIRVFHRPYTNGPAAGRNYGIQMARAGYIAFCDADDFLDITTFERLYNYIIQERHHHDLICYGTNLLRNGEITSVDTFQTPIRQEHLLMGRHVMGFWNKLIKKDLLLECGEIYDTLLDDIGYIPLVISRAKHIGCVNIPLYFFEQEGGASHKSYSPRCLEMLCSIEHVFEIIDPKHLGAFGVCAATRVRNSINANPAFEKEFIQWLQKNRSYFVSNYLLRTDKSLYDQIMSYIEGYEEWIPEVVYVNGFGGDVDEQWVRHVKENIFWDNYTTLVILNENNCDVISDPYTHEAYKNQRYDYLGQLFGLKNVYEHGGFYLGSKVKINHFFGELRKYGAVFAQAQAGAFSGDIFGGVSGKGIFKTLLETYKRGFDDEDFIGLDRRLKNILTAIYGITPDGHKHTAEYVYVASVSQLSIDTGDGKSLCSFDYALDPEECHMVLLERQTLRALSNDTAYVSDLGLRDRCIRAERQLKEILNSDSYKLSQKLKQLGNTKIGALPKRLFKFLLRIYRKVKYGI